MDTRRKTYVEDIDRGIYDIRNEFKYDYIAEKGLTEEIVKDISRKKK